MDYFLNELGLNEAEFVTPPRQNERLDWRSLALLNAIQPYRAEMFGDQKIPMGIADLPFEAPLQIGETLAREIFERLRLSNEVLIKSRPELLPDDLTPNWDNYKGEENLSLLNQPCVFAKPVTVLLAQLQSQIRLEKCRTKLAEAERAFAREHHKNARHFLQRALGLLEGLEADAAGGDLLESMKKRAGKLALALLPKTDGTGQP